MEISFDDKPVTLTSQIQCLNCLDIIVSKHRHDCVFCSCGHTMLDGGKDYQHIMATSGYNNLTITSEDSFEVIRENVYRGSRGPDGRQPLKWIRLSEIDDSYLLNLIDYVEKRGGDSNRYYKYYKMERDLRGI